MTPHLTLRSFGDRLIELLPALMGTLSRLESRYSSRRIITLSQERALAILVKHGPCPMHRLAETLHLKRPSATFIVDRLIKRHLVTRVRSQEDRRIVEVSVTAKGKRVFEEICEQKKEEILNLFGKLSATERAACLKIAGKLAKQQFGTVISKKRGAA